MAALPALSEEGKRRAALMRSSWAAQSALRLDYGLRQLGPLHHARPACLDAADALQQRHPRMAVARPRRHRTGDDPRGRASFPPTARRHPAPRQISNWMGESRGSLGRQYAGRRDRQFPARPLCDQCRGGHGQLAVGQHDPGQRVGAFTERFTITGPDSVHYRATWTDPVVFTAPWTVELIGAATRITACSNMPATKATSRSETI